MDWLLHFFDPAVVGALIEQFRTDVHQPGFWLAVGEIFWINVLLSGDNALVIAMACRSLEPRQRIWGMTLGALAAVILRLIFTGIVVVLMELPYLKLAGGLALIVIAVKLLIPEEEGEGDAKFSKSVWGAVQIVVLADIVMSLDNVIAVAAAAKDSAPLLVIGLVVSVPIIIGGAALIMLLLTRFPALVWVGALLLGWVAGGVIATDAAVGPYLQSLFAGEIGASLDRGLATIGLGPHFTGGERDGVEALFGLVCTPVVAVVGLLRRKGLPAKTGQAMTR